MAKKVRGKKRMLLKLVADANLGKFNEFIFCKSERLECHWPWMQSTDRIHAVYPTLKRLNKIFLICVFLISDASPLISKGYPCTPSHVTVIMC